VSVTPIVEMRQSEIAVLSGPSLTTDAWKCAEPPEAEYRCGCVRMVCSHPDRLDAIAAEAQLLKRKRGSSVQTLKRASFLVQWTESFTKDFLFPGSKTQEV
jgi:hypothetical protein